jgi:hypothetical protein
VLPKWRAAESELREVLRSLGVGIAVGCRPCSATALRTILGQPTRERSRMRTFPIIRQGSRALLVILAGLALLAGVTSCTSALPMKFTGMGPLRIGMTERQAVATGWLSNKVVPACVLDPGGGPGYRLDGPKAPQPIQGSAVFRNGRLQALTIRAGASTDRGMWPGLSTARDVRNAYPAPAFSITSQDVIGVQIATVRQSGNRSASMQFVIEGAQQRVTSIGVPFVPICD